eukprot:2162446-Pleurochrysis_carterae.AAC.1
MQPCSLLRPHLTSYELTNSRCRPRTNISAAAWVHIRYGAERLRSSSLLAHRAGRTVGNEARAAPSLYRLPPLILKPASKL